MKKLLKKIWQGDINLFWAYVLVAVGIYFNLAVDHPFNAAQVDWLSLTFFALALIFLIIKLVILWRSTSKPSFFFWGGLAKILVAFPVLIFGVLFFHQQNMVFRQVAPSPEECLKSYHYSNFHYKGVTKQSMPTGACIVYSNHSDKEHNTRGHARQIILDASKMDLTKWIRKTKFRLNKEYWVDQDLAKSDSTIREWRRFQPLRPDFKVPHTKVVGQISLDDYLSKKFIRLLKCDSRTMGKREDKYYMQMCEALKNKKGVWLMRTSLGQRCCLLDVFAFEKERLIWSIGWH